MILIIQNGYVGTHISEYIEDELEIVRSYETNVELLDLSKYSMVIILGGHQSVTQINQLENLQNVIKLIYNSLEIGIPIFGICLGFQLIAHALGCEIKPSGKLNIGYDTKILGFDNIFRCHYDYIVPNDKIEVLDIFDSMVYAFKYKNLFGIQCHPDIPPEYITNYQATSRCHAHAEKYADIINTNNKKLINYVINVLRMQS
jgi:GMP synthase-like glutamine amidotransferase